MANQPAVQIDVRELRDLSRRLRGLSKDAQKELTVELTNISDRLVVRIKGRVPARSGRARASVRARKAAGGVKIAAGGRTAPHYPWLDFGGSTKVPGAGQRVRRDFVKEGRYIFPTVADHKDEIEHDVADAMQKVARKYDLDMDR